MVQAARDMVQELLKPIVRELGDGDQKARVASYMEALQNGKDPKKAQLAKEPTIQEKAESAAVRTRRARTDLNKAIGTHTRLIR